MSKRKERKKKAKSSSAGSVFAGLKEALVRAAVASFTRSTSKGIEPQSLMFP
jgi:hypothetical protein